jgi:hypothetical protein
MWERVEMVLSEAFGRLGRVLASDLPGLVAMLIVMGAALAVAFVVRALLRRLLARIGFDRRAREWGVTTGRSLEPHHEPSWLVARGAFWFVLLGGVSIALDVLGAGTTSAAGLMLLAFLPRLLVGAVILILGIGAARFVERSALIGAVNLQIQQARLLALTAKWLLLALAGAMALEHVGVGGGLATTAFAILFGGIVLAGALAVGLGAKDIVARHLDRLRPPDAAAPPDEPPEKGRIRHL